MRYPPDFNFRIIIIIFIYLAGKIYSLVLPSNSSLFLSASSFVVLKTELKMYTIYGPPNHQDGTIRTTKEDAERKSEEFDGKTSE